MSGAIRADVMDVVLDIGVCGSDVEGLDILLSFSALSWKMNLPYY